MFKMRNPQHIFFETNKDFRKWLIKNHDKSDGFWMIFYKKHTKTKCIEYQKALEEALCFGWIDNIVKRVDNEKYIRRFTPRRNTKNWSDYNKRKVLNLIKIGKMTQYGLSKIDKSVDLHSYSEKEKVKPSDEIPKFIETEFANNEPALINFRKLAPSHKKQYINWISSAKRQSTIEKRLKEAVKLLQKKCKMELK
ncbi:MAG: hypothetical protein C0595_09590 [Marinilabiliales bacterium]|nr:MAG: hypothetical protein C0595_09590 [Marinilabiliales bacterium]